MRFANGWKCSTACVLAVVLAVVQADVQVAVVRADAQAANHLRRLVVNPAIWNSDNRIPTKTNRADTCKLAKYYKIKIS
jgi:hypothetical protein